MLSYRNPVALFCGMLGQGLLASLFFLIMVPVGSAQQWPLGHQPSPYTVPQYRPANPSPTRPAVPFSYPTAPSIPAPAQDIDSHAGVAPGNPNPTPLSYPLNDQAPPELAPAGPEQNLQEHPPLIDPQQLAPLPVPPPHAAQPALIHTVPQPAQAGNGGVSSAGSPSSVPPAQKTPFGLDYTIFRDVNHYPVDPRKPCNECVRPPLNDFSRHQWPGKKGRPYQDREPGGCECSSASCKQKPNFSVNWPAPFSAILGTHLSSDPNTCAPPRKQLNDRFNHLADFKLIDYRRSDNGYEGPGADRYGCLGESRNAGSMAR